MPKLYRTYDDKGKPLYKDNECYNASTISRMSGISLTTIWRLKKQGKLHPVGGTGSKYKGLDIHRALTGQRNQV